MSEELYQDLKIEDKELISSLDKVIETINYDVKKVQKELFRPDTTREFALGRVSGEALAELESDEKDRDVATYDCNVYKFNNISFDFLYKKLVKFLPFDNIKGIGISGRIWYPVNGYMGWHTNSNNKGYRVYCTFAKEENKSFFRYKNPITNEIVTSYDVKGWNFRVFKIGEQNLWHSVFSETDRFSIGYSVYT